MTMLGIESLNYENAKLVGKGIRPEKVLKTADIIILGAGSPGLIKPDMIKEGAVVLDAGTTDVSGSLKGDADPACAEKTSLFTPVPGGIGPITIAMIYKNLLQLAKQERY